MIEIRDVCDISRELVQKYGTQEKAGRACDVHQNIISRLCRGERSDVRLSTYKKMIAALNKKTKGKENERSNSIFSGDSGLHRRLDVRCEYVSEER